MFVNDLIYYKLQKLCSFYLNKFLEDLTWQNLTIQLSFSHSL